MAQLSDDCFAFGGALMSVDEAVALIAERVAPVAESETVPLLEADHRILAEAVIAAVDLPRFDNSAVDGYAVRFADLKAGGETSLPVRGRLAAGTPAGPATEASALRIFTGAAMPAGFDTVFMQEDVHVAGDGVRLPSGLRLGANRRLAGEDVHLGTMALAAGRRLDPRAVALLSALGMPEVRVRRPLRVGVFSTGDEIVPAGGALGPAQIHDANRPMLVAMLRRLGCVVGDLGILPDRRERLTSALAEAAAGHDLLVTSGGVSTGEEDHVKGAVEALGRIAFWRLAIKPGRPVAMGIVKGTPLIGLPGNPVAVFVTFAFVARALIARLAGEDARPPLAIPVRSGFGYRKKEGRREYVRVRLEREDGTVIARKHPREGAGVISSLTETDGLAELTEAATRLDEGEMVGFLPYATLLS